MSLQCLSFPKVATTRRGLGVGPVIDGNNGEVQQDVYASQSWESNGNSSSPGGSSNSESDYSRYLDWIGETGYLHAYSYSCNVDQYGQSHEYVHRNDIDNINREEYWGEFSRHPEDYLLLWENPLGDNDYLLRLVHAASNFYTTMPSYEIDENAERGIGSMSGPGVPEHIDVIGLTPPGVVGGTPSQTLPDDFWERFNNPIIAQIADQTEQDIDDLTGKRLKGLANLGKLTAIAALLAAVRAVNPITADISTGSVKRVTFTLKDLLKEHALDSLQNSIGDPFDNALRENAPEWLLKYKDKEPHVVGEEDGWWMGSGGIMLNGIMFGAGLGPSLMAGRLTFGALARALAEEALSNIFPVNPKDVVDLGKSIGKHADNVLDKLSRYLLNEDHPIGKDKAAWFKRALGFDKNNIDDLAKQITFDPKKAIPTETTQYGQKFSQTIPITGANGKIIDVEFIWIINEGEDLPKLVTAIPTKK